MKKKPEKKCVASIKYVRELIFFVFKSQESGFDVNFEKRKRALASMIGMSESNCASTKFFDTSKTCTTCTTLPFD